MAPSGAGTELSSSLMRAFISAKSVGLQLVGVGQRGFACRRSRPRGRRGSRGSSTRGVAHHLLPVVGRAARRSRRPARRRATSWCGAGGVRAGAWRARVGGLGRAFYSPRYGSDGRADAASASGLFGYLRGRCQMRFAGRRAQSDCSRLALSTIWTGNSSRLFWRLTRGQSLEPCASGKARMSHRSCAMDVSQACRRSPYREAFARRLRLVNTGQSGCVTFRLSSYGCREMSGRCRAP